MIIYIDSTIGLVVVNTGSCTVEHCHAASAHITLHYLFHAGNYPDTSQTIPWGGMLDEDNVDGTKVYLASSGYNQWNTAGFSSCRISVPQGATLSVTIYDFLSNTSNADCSARLLLVQVTNDITTKVCAQAPWTQRVFFYDARHSGQNVEFVMKQTDSTVVSKLLILLQGKHSFSFIRFAQGIGFPLYSGFVGKDTTEPIMEAIVPGKFLF